MEIVNLILLILSFLIYYLLSFKFFGKPSLRLDRRLQIPARAVFILFLVTPFNINGTIYTIFGNVKHEGDVNSILSMYQSTEKNAFSLISFLGYQEAEKKVEVIVGIPSYQYGRELSSTIFGIPIYQSSAYEARTGWGFTLHRQLVYGKTSSEWFAFFSTDRQSVYYH